MPPEPQVIIDGLAGLHVEHLGHEVDDGAVRVELGGGVAGVVGELLDEILVALAQLVLGQVGDGEFQRGEVLDEVAQHGIGQAILVRPLRIAEDAEELVGVGGLDGPHGLLQGPAHIPADLPNLPPMRVRRNLESVVLREEGEEQVALGFAEGGLGLLVIDVAETLVEKEREDELLVVPRVDRTTQEHGGAPEVGFEVLLGDAGHAFASSVSSSSTASSDSFSDSFFVFNAFATSSRSWSNSPSGVHDTFRSVPKVKVRPLKVNSAASTRLKTTV